MPLPLQASTHSLWWPINEVTFSAAAGRLTFGFWDQTRTFSTPSFYKDFSFVPYKNNSHPHGSTRGRPPVRQAAPEPYPHRTSAA